MRVGRPGRGEDTFGDPHGEWVLPRDSVGQRVGGCCQVVGGVQFGDQMQGEGLLGIEDPPGEQDVQRDGLADELLEPPQAACGGNDPQPGLGLPELEVGSGDAEVGCVGKFRAPPRAKPSIAAITGRGSLWIRSKICELIPVRASSRRRSRSWEISAPEAKMPLPSTLVPEMIRIFGTRSR